MRCHEYTIAIENYLCRFTSLVIVMQQTMAKTKFSKATYLYWYELMLLMRKFEEKAGQLYGQQKIRGFCHLYIGQEAVVAGAISAMQKGDSMITTYRDHA